MKIRLFFGVMVTFFGFSDPIFAAPSCKNLLETNSTGFGNLSIQVKDFMDKAVRSGHYISLTLVDGTHLEGYLINIKTEKNGDVTFIINKFGKTFIDHPHIVLRWDRYHLSEIDPSSLKTEPELAPEPRYFRVHSIAEQSHVAAEMTDLTTNTKNPVQLSLQMINILSSLSNPNTVHGPDLPPEIINLIPPGNRLQIYFTWNVYSLRLTIDHHPNGDWFFGDSSDYRNTTSVDPLKQDEETTLIRHKESKGIPSARLSLHISNILNRLTALTAYSKFSEELTVWSKSIPELLSLNDYTRALKLFLYKKKLYYSLKYGYVNLPSYYSLNANDAKLLAAIEYLIENKLIFITSNSRPRDKGPGIFKIGDEEVNASYLMGIDMVKQLFDSMAQYGLKFVDGVWKKRNLNSGQIHSF